MSQLNVKQYDSKSHEKRPVDDDEDDIEVISHIKSRYIPPPLSITTTSDLVSHFETRNALSPLSHLETTESTYVNSSPDHSHVDVVSNGNSQINWLAELAEIATGPKSPLLQKTRPSPTKSPTKTFLEHSLHSYARPPKSPTTPSDAKETSATKDVVRSLWDESDSRVTSSSPFPASPVEDSNSFSGNWSHSWPTAVWQCFIQGTRLRFTSGPRTEWQLAEELANKEFLAAQAAISQEDSERKSYAPNGLKLLHIEECQPTLSKPDAYMRLRFSSDVDSQPEIIAECALDHPFFIRDKGWSSFHPGLTAEHFGIPCSELEVGDLCLPQSHPDATFTTDVFESFKCYDFTPMDSSAVFALSNMAKIRRDQELSPKSSPTTSPSRKKSSKPDSPTKAKRPMNAFMLFAKKFRVEYTHMYPGKDNRAISCLLGERWKKLKNEERRIYAAEAKLLAEQHKKIHPDCWKRKRSASQGSGE